MSTETPSYHYHYHPLDKLFTEGLDPHYLGDQLDEIMFRLVMSAGDDYPSQLLSWHYYTLLELRDIFLNSKKNKTSR